MALIKSALPLPEPASLYVVKFLTREALLLKDTSPILFNPVGFNPPTVDGSSKILFTNATAAVCARLKEVGEPELDPILPDTSMTSITSTGPLLGLTPVNPN